MRKMVVTRSAGSGGTNAAVFRLVDGGEPEFTGELLNVVPSSGFSFVMYQLTPDSTRCVATDGTASGLFVSTFPPTEDDPIPSPKSPAVAAPTNIKAMTVSDTLVAVGGDSSASLMVYRLSDLGVETVPVSGLGNVRAVRFSPDQSKLAVLHSNSPFLRIYDVADWSFVNAATPPGNVAPTNPGDVMFSPDGTKIVTASSGSPYICAFSVDGTRLAAITSPSLANSAGTFILHPEGTGVIWLGVSSTAGSPRRMGFFDFSSLSASTPYENPTAVIYSGVLDRVANRIYFSHGSVGGRYVTVMDLEGPQANVLRAPGGELERAIQGTGHGLSVLELGAGKITGAVRDVDNNPAIRKIVARHREHGYTSAVTHSDAAGNYSMIVQNTEPHDMQFMAAPGEQLNDLFFARVEPEPV